MPMGNLRSVQNAIHENGFEVESVATQQEFESLTHLVIPGVGAFSAVMKHLEDDGLVEPIRDFARSGRPVLGICVGMQLLAEFGTEGSLSSGLGLVDGTVERLPVAADVPLPHVGWSGVRFTRPHPVLEGVKPDRDFYFVHSYAIMQTKADQVLGKSEYGAVFPAIVGKANVVGFQFHPEKSQANGLKLLENFGRWDGKC